MKIIINNLAWIKLVDIDEVTLHILRNDLTIVPKALGAFNQRPSSIYLFAMNNKWIGIPRPYYFNKAKKLFKAPIEEEYRISQGIPLSSLETNITLRPEDQEPLAQFVVEFCKQREFAGAAIEAFTSFGKTITMFEIIKRIGLNTLVILHRENLVDQWKKSLSKFWPNVTTGRIQGNVMDYKKDITFAMLQTLMTDNNDKFPAGFFNHFGLIVVDENHIMGAEKFGTVLPKFSNKYTLMLSGTQYRQDGCENVFKYCGGDVIVKASEQNRIRPTVYVMDTKYTPERPVSSKTSALSLLENSKSRNQLIAVDIVKALKANRNPLVMSERLEQLRGIREAVDRVAKLNNVQVSHGMFIGGKTERELDQASNCSVVYATIQLAKEGVDIVRLDTLFLASPVSSIEQISGRICRYKKDKLHPYFLDYVDLNISVCKSSFVNRYKMYKHLQFEVKGTEGHQFGFLDYVKL